VAAKAGVASAVRAPRQAKPPPCREAGVFDRGPAWRASLPTPDEHRPPAAVDYSPRALTPPPCVACGSPSSVPAFEASDWYLGRAPGSFAYRRCTECLTVFVDPQPDDSTLSAAYAADYGPLQAQEGTVARLGERLAQREADRLTHLAERTTALVDIGCGTGAFLRRLQRAGWEGPLQGVEPDERAARYAQEHTGVPVKTGTLETLNLEPGSAGTVVMRHVIEHLRAPRAALERVGDFLAPHGVLYLATPDARALAARVFGRFWHGYDPPRHLFAFTSDGIRKLLARTGFTVIDEHWQFSPQMWTGSLRHTLNRGHRRRWAELAGHDLNPVAAVPAVIGATAEVAMHRSTMYTVTARAER
jgi:SAM-dependent methyltransferase